MPRTTNALKHVMILWKICPSNPNHPNLPANPDREPFLAQSPTPQGRAQQMVPTLCRTLAKGRQTLTWTFRVGTDRGDLDGWRFHRFCGMKLALGCLDLVLRLTLFWLRANIWGTHGIRQQTGSSDRDNPRTRLNPLRLTVYWALRNSP